MSSVSHPIRNDIQVLRGLAVLLVLQVHMLTSFGDGYRFLGNRFEFFSGGAVGVNIFFTISGFVITSLLLREFDNTGSVSLKKFYGRRIKRILPVASLVLLVALVLNFRLMQADYYSILNQVMFSSINVVNWYYSFNDIPAASSVGHYWSLSVEEQFYFVWPAVMGLAVLLYKKYNVNFKKVVNFSLTLFVIFSLAYHIFFAVNNVSFYSATFNHVWELGVGALIAVNSGWLLERFAGFNSMLVLGGSALIGAVVVLSSASSYLTTVLWSLPAVLGVSMIIVAGSNKVEGRFMNSRIMMWFGDVSFSLYLWHYVLLMSYMHFKGRIIDNMVSPGLFLASLNLYEIIALTGLSIVISWLSTKYFENPIRHASMFKDDAFFSGFGLKKYNIPNSYILGAGVMVVLFSAISLSYMLAG